MLTSPFACSKICFIFKNSIQKIKRIAEHDYNSKVCSKIPKQKLNLKDNDVLKPFLSNTACKYFL